jgi:uncharacterized protein with NRDE domain
MACIYALSALYHARVQLISSASRCSYVLFAAHRGANVACNAAISTIHVQRAAHATASTRVVSVQQEGTIELHYLQLASSMHTARLHSCYMC